MNIPDSAPKIATITLAALLQGACTAHDSNGNCYDLLAQCEDNNTSSQNNHIPQASQQTNLGPILDTEETHSEVPSHSEGIVSANLGFSNSHVHLYNFQTKQLLFTFETDSDGNADFELVGFMNLLQNKGIQNESILYLEVDNGGLIRDDGTTWNIKGNVEYILSGGDIRNIIDNGNLRKSEAGMIYADKLLKEGNDVINNENELFIDNIGAQITANISQNMGIGDVNGDGKITHKDINLSHSNDYAKGCIDYNNYQEVKIHEGPFNDVHILEFEGYTVDHNKRLQFTYGKNFDNNHTVKQLQYRVNGGDWLFASTPAYSTIFVEPGSTVETQEVGEDSNQINRYQVSL